MRVESSTRYNRMRPPDPPEQDAAAAAEHERAQFAQSALENLFDVSPDAVFVTDGEGVIRGANPRAAEMFGHTQAELYGQPIESLVPERFRRNHPKHRENYNAHPRARQMGAALNLFGLRKDGTEFPVDIMLKPIETALGPTVLSFVRDVTEQRASEVASRHSDMQLRSIVESVHDYAIYLLDPDGCITTWNPGAERIKGYAAEEILGLHFSRFFTQEDIDRGRPAELLDLACPAFCVDAQPSDGEIDRDDFQRDHGGACSLAVAGEYSRVRELSRACGDSYAGFGALCAAGGVGNECSRRGRRFGGEPDSADRGARTHPARAARGQGPDWRRRWRCGATGPEAHHIKFQTKEARH